VVGGKKQNKDRGKGMCPLRMAGADSADGGRQHPAEGEKKKLRVGQSSRHERKGRETKTVIQKKKKI